MSARDVLLSVHVAAGSLGLLLGLVAMLTERPPDYRNRAGTAYVWAVVAVAVTAGGLVALDPSALWWLWPLAALTCALVLVGYRAPSRRGRGWVRAYAHGQGGAYIALVTALLVVSLDEPVTVAGWVVPMVVGLPLIERRVSRIKREVASPAVTREPLGFLRPSRR